MGALGQCKYSPPPPPLYCLKWAVVRVDRNESVSRLNTTFARRAAAPAVTAAAMSLTVVYDREQKEGSVPSLTLVPRGKEISFHFPVLWPFGITPNLLMCSGGRPSGD